MRRFSAILLLCCFALYHFGYYVFYFSYQYKIEHTWQAKVFDENPDFSQKERLMEIPLSLPYASDQEDFKATNTSFEKNGEYYRVVKQRYANDTLQIIYIPDTAKNRLDQSVRQWITSLVNDDLPDGNGNQLIAKLFPKDYTQPHQDIIWERTTEEQQLSIGFIFLAYQNQVKDLHSPPPEWV
ncbi:hypothetical protein [Pararhodonellum marinum]|uniref:hypothetical protein n=1 Tax=Pararhodonellum marinum TaxID=2755358 RepID=UPI00188F86EC|nr:hypothetical protein [Pararhodonellum marinum]